MTLQREEIKNRINDSYEVPNDVTKNVATPVVSVFVPTYQHIDFIGECVEGVLMQQTSFPFEFIIGEDFSTDGTREMVLEYAKKHPGLIRVITADRNVGIKANLTRGLKACRGKYVALCDGDDYWTDPLKLQKQVAFMEANPDYALCFHSHRIKKDGRLLKTLYPKNPRDYSADELIAEPGTIRVLTKLVKNIFAGKSIDEISHYCGDCSMTSKLGSYGKGKYLPGVLPSVYRHHQGGDWTSRQPEDKLFGSVNAKVHMYRHYLSIMDKRRALVCLRALHETLEKKRGEIYPGHKRFRLRRTGIQIVFGGIWFELYFKPFLLSLKTTIKRTF